MKNTTILVVLLSITFIGKSQNVDSSVEVKLQLLRQIIKSNGDTLHGFVLSVSIINHSNKDVYIPYFDAIDVHYYDNNTTNWKEVELYFGDGSDTLPYWSDSIARSNDGMYPNDPIYNYYFDTVATNSFRQIKLVESSLGIKSASHYIGTHLFLKAKEEIDHYEVYPVGKLLKKKTDYKITFNTEPRDKTSMLKDKSQELPTLYLPHPNNIKGYEIYMPNKIVSNTIYFSTKDSQTN